MTSKMVELKFKYEDFLQEDICNLMINIWSYSDEHGTGCNICTHYKKMNIDALRKKWSNDYIDFNFVINKLKKRDTEWYDLNRVSTADRFCLMPLIKKKQ